MNCEQCLFFKGYDWHDGSLICSYFGGEANCCYKRHIEISKLPNFEVKCSDGKDYVLLPFKHLSDIPTADVKEVKHGKWKYECLECSVCKRNISEICDADSYLTSGIEYELLFCPFCGTKMDL